MSIPKYQLFQIIKLQKEGGLYFREEYAVSSNDSCTIEDFAGKAVRLLFNRIIDIVDISGTGTV